jgi:hypothetical protein
MAGPIRGLDDAAERIRLNDRRTHGRILTDLTKDVRTLTAGQPIRVSTARRAAARLAADALALLYLTGGDPGADLGVVLDVRIHLPRIDRDFDSVGDRGGRAHAGDWWVNGDQYAQLPAADYGADDAAGAGPGPDRCHCATHAGDWWANSDVYAASNYYAQHLADESITAAERPVTGAAPFAVDSLDAAAAALTGRAAERSPAGPDYPAGPVGDRLAFADLEYTDDD